MVDGQFRCVALNVCAACYRIGLRVAEVFACGWSHTVGVAAPYEAKDLFNAPSVRACALLVFSRLSAVIACRCWR